MGDSIKKAATWGERLNVPKGDKTDEGFIMTAYLDISNKESLSASSDNPTLTHTSPVLITILMRYQQTDEHTLGLVDTTKTHRLNQAISSTLLACSHQTNVVAVADARQPSVVAMLSVWMM